MSYPQRMMHPPAHRLNELLDAIKQEFENMNTEASTFRIHKDEFDQRFNQQTAEIQQIRQTIYDLEVQHRKMKESYEDEILRLKREIETRDANQGSQPAQQAVPPPSTSSQQTAQQPLAQPGHGLQLQQPPQAATDASANSAGAAAAAAAGGAGSQPPAASTATQYDNRYPYEVNGNYDANSQQAAQAQQAQAAQAQQAAQQQAQAQQAAQQQQQQQQQPSQPQSQAQTQPQQSQPQSGGASIAAVTQNAAPSANGETYTEDDARTISLLGNNLCEFDIEKVPDHLKKVRDDWFVVYNERAPRQIDVEMVQSLEHHSVVCCVRFSLDGKYVATGCNRSAQIYDVATGQLICKLSDDSTADREGDLYIRSVCFSPDGRYLATGAEDKQIRVWDIKNRSIKYLFSGHEQDIYSLDYSRNGRHIASGSGDRTVRLWDMETGQCSLSLSIEDGVTTVAISPDGRLVAAGSLDRTVRVWDAVSGFLVERLDAQDGHKDSVYSVAFTPSGQDLVSGSLDRTLKLWELQAARGAPSSHTGGKCIKTFVGHKDFVLSVASTPDSNWILSGSKDRGVQFWDPRTAQVQLMLQGHKNSVISVAPSPQGGLFATGSGDCRARIWRYYPVGR